MAAVIRDAIDAYVTEPPADLAGALRQTFGALPGLAVPSRGEWAKRD